MSKRKRSPSRRVSAGKRVSRSTGGDVPVEKILAEKRPEVDLDSLTVRRNYLLLAGDVARTKLRGPGGAPGQSRNGDQLGQSRAVRILLNLAGGRLPKPPEKPLYSGGSLTDQVGSTEQMSFYGYTREVQLATEEMGYGENTRDVFWQVGESTRPTVKTLSLRRTKTGRQVLPAVNAYGVPVELVVPDDPAPKGKKKKKVVK